MTKTKLTTVKHKAKPYLVSEPIAQVVEEISAPLEIEDKPAVAPKERLLFAAAVIDDLLPTYSGPGRRYLEAVKINLEQAIKYTP